MIFFQDTLKLGEHAQGAYEITGLIEGVIKESGVHTGTCHLFLHSSTSSLVLCDTADESTKNATEDFMAELAPSSFNAEGKIKATMEATPDNMRGMGAQNEITIPVSNARHGIGVWQGIFFWEERKLPIERKLTVTIMGEALHKSFRLTRG